MLWVISRAFVTNVPEQLLWMNGCSASSPTLLSATHPALTSQSVQLSHPTVLILLGNDLKNREWKTLVKDCSARKATATWVCVHNEELLCSQLCQCSVLTWPRAFKVKKVLQALHYPCSLQFWMGHPQLKCKCILLQPYHSSVGSVKLGLRLDQINLLLSCMAARKGTLCLH